jgi:predicted N-formylglutamate amidohydrolase
MNERVVEEEAFEEIRGVPEAPIFLTCEHASSRLPAPWQWPVQDTRLLGTHWAFDLGAREVTLELAEALGASAVLSRFTRLLVDPNREEHHRDLLRGFADGAEILLNRALDEADREVRLSRYYRPFHDAVDRVLVQTRAPILLSVHSFTPLYEGVTREVQLGVLFNKEERAANALVQALSNSFDGVAHNEPWSGRDGLIFSAESHAERHGRVALEIEVRQDLAMDPAYRAKLVSVLAGYFAP